MFLKLLSQLHLSVSYRALMDNNCISNKAEHCLLVAAVKGRRSEDGMEFHGASVYCGCTLTHEHTMSKFRATWQMYQWNVLSGFYSPRTRISPPQFDIHGCSAGETCEGDQQLKKQLPQAVPAGGNPGPSFASVTPRPTASLGCILPCHPPSTRHCYHHLLVTPQRPPPPLLPQLHGASGCMHCLAVS